MTGLLPIRASIPHQKIKFVELEEDEKKIKNIFFLLFVLTGINGSELLEKQVQRASSKAEYQKEKIEKRQKQIDNLNKRIEIVSFLYDQLNETGRNLEDLTESERHKYFENSRELQYLLEDLQTEVKQKMVNTSQSMQEMMLISKMDIEPLKQVIEALQNMGRKLSDLFTSQWGNNIKFNK